MVLFFRRSGGLFGRRSRRLPDSGKRNFQENNGFFDFLENYRAVNQPLGDRDDGGGIDDVLFATQSEIDFRPEVGNIPWIASDKAEHLGEVMGMRVVERHRLGNAMVTHAAVCIQFTVMRYD
jgi:hypothetical protein